MVMPGNCPEAGLENGSKVGLGKDKLYLIELDASVPFSAYHPLLPMLSGERRARLDAFRMEQDKKASAISGLWVRHLAGQYLNVENSELKFEVNAYGKPGLVGAREFHFNLSHTRGAAAVGISREPVGVDIEKMGQYEEGVARRFFCKNEVRYIEKGSARRRFYEVWTKKEAYIKWLGKGLAIPLPSFDVFAEEASRHLESFQKDEYMVSVCHTGKTGRDAFLEIEEIGEKEVLTQLFSQDFRRAGT